MRQPQEDTEGRTGSVPEAIGAGLTIGAVSVILVLGVASWGVAGALLVVGVGAALVSGLS